MVAPSDKIKKRQKFPTSVLAQIRTLYVVKGLGPTEIAPRFNLVPTQISQMAIRYGWQEERQKRAKRLENQLATRAQDEHAAFMASMASQAEELAEDSLAVARDAVGAGLGATRELQQSSQSAKNFVDIYFKVNRLDANQGGSQVNIGNFFCNIQSADTAPAQRSEKVVTPEPVEAETKLISRGK